MPKYMIVSLLASATVLTGCATALTTSQKLEYEAMKSNGLLVEEKSPGAGVVLGLLPGGGSFYARETRLGIVNFLLWPLSMLWDPVSGYEGAKVINYDASKRAIRKQKDSEVGVLDDKLRAGEITNAEYRAELQKIEAKYNY